MRTAAVAARLTASPRGAARVRGPKAGRLIRFLCDVTPPYSVSEIALATRLTPGYVSRLLESLDSEALSERTKRGQVVSTHVPGLLSRWTESYDVFKTNRSQTFVARQGPANLMQRDTDDGDIAITGSFAAVRLAPVAAPAMLVAYARDVGTRERVHWAYSVTFAAKPYEAPPA